MALYRASFSTLAIRSATSAPLCDIRTTATDAPRLMGVYGNILNSGGLALVLGIGTPASLGTAKTNSIAFIADDPSSPPCTVTVGIDWTVMPTIPTNFLRRITTLSGSSLSMLSMPIPGGIAMGTSSSLVLWIVSANVTPVASIIADLDLEIDA